MSIHRTKPNHLKKISKGFTTLPNATMELIQDPAAIGILIYLLSKTDNWEIVEGHLMNRFGKGRDFIRARLADLRKVRLLKKRAIKNNSGQVIRWVTEIYDMPYEEENQITENPPSGKPTHLENPTHTKLKKENEIKETTTTQQQPKTEHPSSSDFIISKEIDEQLLNARNGLPDDRDDKEFLLQCMYHLEKSSKAGYNTQQALSGLHKIISKGFETPAGYKPKSKSSLRPDVFTKQEWDIIDDYRHVLKLKIDFKIFFPTDEKLKEAKEIYERYLELMAVKN